MANSYLNRTPSSTGNRRKFTFSFWIKKSANGTSETIYNVRPDSNGANRISWHSTDTLRIAFEPISKYIFTTRKFRDLSAWYHIVIAVDTEQATAANRVKLYVNGVLQTLSSETDPVFNSSTRVSDNSGNIAIGSLGYAPNLLLCGYLAETVFIDGSQLTASDFGQTDSDTGIWKPKDVSGLSFGTTGFYLKYDNSSSLGADSSGNGNNFTSVNLDASHQSTNTPTFS